MTPENPPPSKRSPSGTAARGADRAPKTGTGTALAFLIAVLVTGPACLYAVYAAELSARPAVAWAGGSTALLLSAAVALATRGFLLGRRLRAVIRQKDEEADAERAVAAHFADVVVPILVERLRSGASAQTALAAVPTVANNAYQRVLHLLANEVHRGEGMRAAAMAACANAAGRVQALATSMAADLRELEHKYSDEEVLGDLLHLDHRTAQTGRLADSIAVLTGARTGRRWAKPIVMESILRGAMGRISGYQRVRLHSSCELAVAGHAAEGIMHALAEIMDNACNFSPPTSEVHVYVEEASAGVIVTVEDGGLVMGDVALQRAQQAVSAESLDLANLSGTRLGLAVVGRLAHKHNLSVSFRPSAHGGTGVLLMIPQALITQPKRESQPMTRETGSQPRVPEGSAGLPASSGPAGLSRPGPKPSTPAAESGAQIPPPRTEGGLPKRRRQESAPAASSAPAPEPEPSPEHAPVDETGGGLPKRRRGQTLAAAQQRSSASAADRSGEPARSAEQSGSRFGAFRRAVQGGPSSAEPKPDDDASSPSPAPSSSRPEDHTE